MDKISRYKGQSVDNVLFNENIYAHSKDILSVLENYLMAFIKENPELDEEKYNTSYNDSSLKSNYT